MSDPAATALDMAVALVAQFEGFRSAPYLDTAGVWTIGFGTTHIDGQPVSAATPPVTEAEAHALMDAELGPTCSAVARLCPGGATPQQIAACTSFAYNEGLSAFAGSTLLHLWISGDTADAADQFLLWVYDHDPVTHQLVVVEGLHDRRAAERATFLSG